MFPDPVVLIVRDRVVGDALDAIAARLEAQGVTVRRGIASECVKRPLEASVVGEDLKASAVIVSTSRYVIDARTMKLAPLLHSIVLPTIGTDTVDAEAARRRGITVVNSITWENVESLAEATVLLMLSLLRRPRTALEAPRSLSGKTVGLLGFGRVGQAVAARLREWNVEVIVHTRSQRNVARGVRWVSLEVLLSGSDVVSVHSTLDATTRHLLDRSALARMKSGAYLVNTSRGGIVDEDALCDALEKGHLAGAAIDVFETEPLPPDSRLRLARGTILTPHRVGHTVELYSAIEEAAYANVATALARVRMAYGAILGQPPCP